MPASSGRMIFDGAERSFTSPHEAKDAGIETVYQDLSLCTNVDVVANFFMGRELTRRILGIPVLRERDMEAETAARSPPPAPPSRRSAPMSSISPAASARRSSSTASSIGAASSSFSTSLSQPLASSRRGAASKWSSACARPALVS